MPEDIQLDESIPRNDLQSYPITVKLRHLDESGTTPAQNNSNIPNGLFRSNLVEDDGDDLLGKNRGIAATSEIVRAKYVIGADGAHSWTRRKLGLKLEGESTDYIVNISLRHYADRLTNCTVGCHGHHSDNQLSYKADEDLAL